MIKENITAKKTRYISIRNAGEEIYIENFPPSGTMKDYIPALKLRLREIQKIMPLAKWSITIEQQWKEGNTTHFQTMDIMTEKLEESII